MGPERPLPISKDWNDADDYVSQLLQFVTTSQQWRLLSGRVHILDFFVSSPDLYESVLPEKWRDWLKLHSIEDLLDFLFREDLTNVRKRYPEGRWREQKLPPRSFLAFVSKVRKLQLRRDCDLPDHPIPKMSPRTAVGMNRKKIHEVERFASYVDKLAKEVAESRHDEHGITQFVDFGAGQGYLGRTLASEPYNRNVIALEGRSHNIEGARVMDTSAKVAPKIGVMRNKKAWRAEQAALKKRRDDGVGVDSEISAQIPQTSVTTNPKSYLNGNVNGSVHNDTPDADLRPNGNKTHGREPESKAPPESTVDGKGTVIHVTHQLSSGNLSSIIADLHPPKPRPNPIPQPPDHTTQSTHENPPSLLTTSLHSCGNLTHHALRSLPLNPSVRAVAVVGCCYNLLTPRLTPPSYKLPGLRPAKDALSRASAGDPNGFPMSSRFAEYPLPASDPQDPSRRKGVDFPITARMMAVQAPANWGPADCNSFFTRHFYRALLQRVFVDRGVAPVQTPPTSSSPSSCDNATSEQRQQQAERSATDRPPGGVSAARPPIVIGCLRRDAYTDFPSYARGAVRKLCSSSSPSSELPEGFADKMAGITDEELGGYARAYGAREKELSVLWTLMAFCATLVEAAVVVDRWVWLREQAGCVGECWVEGVWEYGVSPRNLVVVGVKKRGSGSGGGAEGGGGGGEGEGSED